MIQPLDPRVEVDAGARQDLSQAIRYYRTQRRERAVEFLDELRAAIDRVARAPHRWPEIGEGYRRYVLRRFPYVLIYEVESGGVVITAVAHGRRKPGYWQAR